MKFVLTCAYDTDHIYEKYPQIKENFKTEEELWKTGARADLQGKSIIEHYFHFIYIKSIKDLLKLKKITQQDLIICKNTFYPDIFEIMIYDDWIE